MEINTYEDVIYRELDTLNKLREKNNQTINYIEGIKAALDKLLNITDKTEQHKTIEGLKADLEEAQARIHDVNGSLLYTSHKLEEEFELELNDE